MENGSQMTLGQWMPEACPMQIAGALDSPVRTSQLRETVSDSQDTVQACFLQLQGLLETSRKKVDPSIYLLRTLKTYLVLIEGLTSPGFSLNWMKSGMMQNGKFLTQKTSEFHRTGKECSLLDILEDEVPEKYFLSEKQIEYITKSDRMGKYTKLHNV